MITIRRSNERGHYHYGWLNTNHTFSFGKYYDPLHMGFRALRVINEDRVQPGEGFSTHPHSDMEILTYVMEGALEHKDSMGNGGVIQPGEWQRMTAGTGILHSEFDHSSDSIVHFLQIWILPEKQGLTPSYEQKTTRASEGVGKLNLIASGHGEEGALVVHQDVRVYMGIPESGKPMEYRLLPDRYAWVQVTCGGIYLNNNPLNQGDGASISGGDLLTFRSEERAAFLLFDLA